MLYVAAAGFALQYELTAGGSSARFLPIDLKSVSQLAHSLPVTNSAGPEARRPASSTSLINQDKVDALSIIVHRDNAYQRSRDLVDKMQRTHPQADVRSSGCRAAIGSAIIARHATVKACSRKNVLAEVVMGSDIRPQTPAAGGRRRRQETRRVVSPDPTGSVSHRGTSRPARMKRLISGALCSARNAAKWKGADASRTGWLARGTWTNGEHADASGCALSIPEGGRWA